VPELPSITAYVEALERVVAGHELERVRIRSPFLLRSVAPPVSAAHGRRVIGVRNIGKRVVLELEPRFDDTDRGDDGGDTLFIVIHLMIAGRLRWKKAGVRVPKKRGLAAFDFEHGSILFTEASTKKRASLHMVAGEDALAAHDPGGIDVFESSLDAFRGALTARNHTLKRALTDPKILSGIGNAFSDEILFAARFSPFKQTKHLDDADFQRLFDATRDVLETWTERYRQEVGEGFPDKVTAFHPAMAVHGKYGEACPRCDQPVQRIRYAENEANYCAACQTDGKLLADRALSRLLRDDWPSSLEALEAHKEKLRSG